MTESNASQKIIIPLIILELVTPMNDILDKNAIGNVTDKSEVCYMCRKTFAQLKREEIKYKPVNETLSRLPIDRESNSVCEVCDKTIVDYIQSEGGASDEERKSRLDSYAGWSEITFSYMGLRYSIFVDYEPGKSFAFSHDIMPFESNAPDISRSELDEVENKLLEFGGVSGDFGRWLIPWSGTEAEEPNLSPGSLTKTVKNVKYDTTSGLFVILDHRNKTGIASRSVVRIFEFIQYYGFDPDIVIPKIETDLFLEWSRETYDAFTEDDADV